jgi:hypothetical protein
MYIMLLTVCEFGDNWWYFVSIITAEMEISSLKQLQYCPKHIIVTLFFIKESFLEYCGSGPRITNNWSDNMTLRQVMRFVELYIFVQMIFQYQKKWMISAIKHCIWEWWVEVWHCLFGVLCGEVCVVRCFHFILLWSISSWRQEE